MGILTNGVPIYISFIIFLIFHEISKFNCNFGVIWHFEKSSKKGQNLRRRKKKRFNYLVSPPRTYVNEWAILIHFERLFFEKNVLKNYNNHLILYLTFRADSPLRRTLYQEPRPRVVSLYTTVQTTETVIECLQSSKDFWTHWMTTSGKASCLNCFRVNPLIK